MCGILFSAYQNQQSCELVTQSYHDLFQSLMDANTLRGPDGQKQYRMEINPVLDKIQDVAIQSTLKADFFASELCLRGVSQIIQPHTSESGDVLCWNGEIFDGLTVKPEENDGAKLFDALKSLATIEQVYDFFGSIEGPYAFVYFHAQMKILFFARDPLGRRSLLIHKPTTEWPYLLLSSVSSGSNFDFNFEELPTNFFYCLDLNRTASDDIVSGFSKNLSPLPRMKDLRLAESILPYEKAAEVNRELPPDDLAVPLLDHLPEYLVQSIDELINYLDKSVMLRVRDIPRRVDASGKARVAILFSGGIDCTVLTYFAHKHIPIDEPVDLLNVAFENPRKIRNQVGRNLDGFPQGRKKHMAHMQDLEQPLDISYMVPDRVTGLRELEELRQLCPGRTWNFVEINVTYAESQEVRQQVESLMLPRRTVMDLSLAMALYFASRGEGQVREAPDAVAIPYISDARVLLSGLGSDELLGGYGRHRTVYFSGGWDRLIEELQLEIDRIPARNLGRDDRVISSHGKETRHPFLSLKVVNFLASLPVHYKVDPRLEVGVGDKLLLRLLARKVGLVEASVRKKRAMQFGSHSARMEVDSEKYGESDIYRAPL